MVNLCISAFSTCPRSICGIIFISVCNFIWYIGKSCNSFSFTVWQFFVGDAAYAGVNCYRCINYPRLLNSLLFHVNRWFIHLGLLLKMVYYYLTIYKCAYLSLNLSLSYSFLGIRLLYSKCRRLSNSNLSHQSRSSHILISSGYRW